ncbi:MAG: NAD-dependent deacetylase [Flavobacteriales bacterium]
MSDKKEKKLVVFTGSGISAESGIKTFRDSGGLWEDHDISEVATPEAWENNPELVLDFYNKRRKNVLDSEPNDAHKAIANLENYYDVKVITQNIDDLHERAGSSEVIHLHGEILKARSSSNPDLLYEVKEDGIKMGDKCDEGSQLRPHVVWFGEPVPEMERAFNIAMEADILLVVGTSLVVYPAAGIVTQVSEKIKKYVVDPNSVPVDHIKNVEVIKSTATEGVPPLVDRLLKGS